MRRVRSSARPRSPETLPERKLAQERQELLTHEINHRTKNIFALVQAVISRSFADKRTVKEAEQAVLSRLHSLAQTHVMLIDKEWQGADIAEVVRTEMSPMQGAVTIEGPSIMLERESSPELRTGSARTSDKCRKVWSAIQSFRSRPYQLVGRKAEWSSPISVPMAGARWTPSDPPSRKGFGSTVLEQVMAEYFEMPPQMEFAADGVRYEVVGELESIAAQPTH